MAVSEATKRLLSAGMPRRCHNQAWGEVTSLAKKKPPVRVLPKALFLEQLRYERLLVDRSKATLSLIVIEFDCHEIASSEDRRDLLHLLHSNTRETDSLGYLDVHALGLLLPNTTATGAKVILNKLVAANTWPRVSLVAKTYPDELFDALRAAPTDSSTILPPFLPELNASKSVQSLLKRGIDIFGVLVALPMFLPIMVFTAIAIKLISPGPVLFKQIRLGKDLTPFAFFKFRSMYAGADDRVHRDYLANLISGNLNEIDEGTKQQAFYKMKSDRRITTVGRFIRKFSIDELPQLFNVLKGEMSLVGPRPPIPYETERYEAWHLRRILEVKPGITGLWQVEGRSRTSFDDMVRLDLQYSREWSILLDLKILIKTIGVVLACRGAA